MMMGLLPRNSRTPVTASSRSSWKEELRTQCLERVRRNREALLQRIRSSPCDSSSPSSLTSVPLTDGNRGASGSGASLRAELSREVQEALSQQRLLLAGRSADASHSLGPPKARWAPEGTADARNPNGTAAEALTAAESEELLLEMERELYADLRQRQSMGEAHQMAEDDERMRFEEAQLASLVEREEASVVCPICQSHLLFESGQDIVCPCGGFRLPAPPGTAGAALPSLQLRLLSAAQEHCSRGPASPQEAEEGRRLQNRWPPPGKGAACSTGMEAEEEEQRLQGIGRQDQCLRSSGMRAGDSAPEACGASAMAVDGEEERQAAPGGGREEEGEGEREGWPQGACASPLSFAVVDSGAAQPALVAFCASCHFWKVV